MNPQKRVQLPARIQLPALIDVGAESDDSSDEEKALRASIAEIDRAIQEADALCMRAESKLSMRLASEIRVCTDLEDRMRELERELDELMSDPNDMPHNEKDDEEDEFGDEETDANAVHEEKGHESKTSRLTKRCKELFRKISSRCHPDKLKANHPRRAELSELFIQAVKAYRALDISVLLRIFEAIDLASARAAVKHVVEELRTQLEAKRSELVQRRNRQEYAIAVAYEEGTHEERNSIVEFLRNMRVREIHNMSIRIEHLEKQLAEAKARNKGEDEDSAFKRTMNKFMSFVYGDGEEFQEDNERDIEED